MNKTICAALGSAALALGLAACGGETEEPAPANPEAPEGISVSDARLNLPAVAGNPGALYFTVENDSEADSMIMSVYIEGAESAVMHQTATWNNRPDMQEVLSLPIPAGEALVLEPGGFHVMAMNPQEGLQVGAQTEVTLTFAGGDKVSFPAEILAPGDEGVPGKDDGS